MNTVDLYAPKNICSILDILGTINPRYLSFSLTMNVVSVCMYRQCRNRRDVRRECAVRGIGRGGAGRPGCVRGWQRVRRGERQRQWLRGGSHGWVRRWKTGLAEDRKHTFFGPFQRLISDWNVRSITLIVSVNQMASHKFDYFRRILWCCCF